MNESERTQDNLSAIHHIIQSGKNGVDLVVDGHIPASLGRMDAIKWVINRQEECESVITMSTSRNGGEMYMFRADDRFSHDLIKQRFERRR